MIKIGDKEYTLNFTIEKFEEFEKHTGIDILFDGAELTGTSLKKQFICIFSDCPMGTVNAMNPKEFFDVFAQILKKYNEQFKAEEKKESKKK